MAGATLVALIGAITLFVAPPVLPSETETHGYLLPANDRPRSQDKSCVPDKDHTIVALGSVLLLQQREASNATPTLEVGNTFLLWVRQSHQGLLIDADFYDASGRLAARVSRNEFHLVPAAISYAEARPTDDRSTLWVMDTRGNTLLYVRYANPQTVLISANFNVPNAEPLVVGIDYMTVPVGTKIFGKVIPVGPGAAIAPQGPPDPCGFFPAEWSAAAAKRRAP